MTAQVVLYVAVLFACFALVYDMGNVAMVAQIAQAAAATAAQDAARDIAEGAFKSSQRVSLSDDAVDRAAGIVAGMLPAPVEDLSVALAGPEPGSAVIVSFRVRAATPILRACFGLQGVRVPAFAAAEPAWGTEGERR